MRRMLHIGIGIALCGMAMYVSGMDISRCEHSGMLRRKEGAFEELYRTPSGQQREAYLLRYIVQGNAEVLRKLLCLRKVKPNQLPRLKRRSL